MAIIASIKALANEVESGRPWGENLQKLLPLGEFQTSIVLVEGADVTAAGLYMENSNYLHENAQRCVSGLM